jgi:hypothetical protein
VVVAGPGKHGAFIGERAGGGGSAVLAGAWPFAAVTDWACDLDRPAPAATTVWRLLIRIDHEALFARWLRARAAPVLVAGRR